MNYYQLGRKKLEEKDMEGSCTYFTGGMLAGDPKCTYGLVALAGSIGAPMEHPLAELQKVLLQLTAMAENGDADACFIMGRCCEMGIGSEKNIPEAIVWYVRSAGLGNADAMFNLGCIYLQLDPDAEQLAIAQFRQAADRGCREAKAALEHYYNGQ